MQDSIDSKSVTQTDKPNFILIIADDMSWDDSGAYGNPNIRTPNIDRLAKEGMRFDQAFLTTSSCSPSRASIITGMYPHNTDAEQLHWPIPADKTTFVEKLKASGYWTALAGKYHLGDAMRDRFDLIKEVGTAGFQLSSDGKQVKGEADGSGCENWVSLLKERPKNKPFFLWLAAIDPHRPYEEGIVANPHSPSQVRIPPYLPDNDAVRKDFALYYDEISRMDHYVGNVLEELDQQGIEDNTLILFISDNGRPFPRDKTTLYDSGIKTPWIVRWPAKVKAGSKCASLVSSVDIAPTFLHLADVAVPSNFEGKDFSLLLTHPENTIRDQIYAEDNWHDFEDYTRAIRTSEFKYIRNFYPDLPNTPPADALRSPTFQSIFNLHEEGKLNEVQKTCFAVPRPSEELYHIASDPNELHNLALDPQYQAVLKDMSNKLETIRQQTDDQLPKYRTPDEFNRSTGQPNSFRQRPRPSKKEMIKIIEEMSN